MIEHSVRASFKFIVQIHTIIDECFIIRFRNKNTNNKRSNIFPTLYIIYFLIFFPFLLLMDTGGISTDTNPFNRAIV